MSESVHNTEKEFAPINWPVTAVLGGTFLAAVTVVPWYGIVHGYSGWAWIFFGIFLVLNGIGIGSGYHRLWSHRTYEAHPALKWFLAVMGGMSLQNSIIIWSARHRIHHRDVDDNDKDPYSIGRGFWFAHIGWMLRDYRSSEIDYSVVNRLIKKRDLEALIDHSYRKAGNVKTVKMLDELKNLGFYHAAKAGFSISLSDMVIPENKAKLIEKGQTEVDDVRLQHDSGIITDGERYNKEIDIWSKVTNEVGEASAGASRA